MPAQAAEVVSSNIVGYDKITLQPGYNAISAQFVPVGANSLSDVLDVMDASVLPSMDPDTATGEGYARLQTWDTAGSYTSYEWTGTGIAQAWDWAGIDNKWMTEGASDVAEVTLDKGEGVWLWLDPTQVSSAITMTIAGQVPTNETVTLSLEPGYNLIANPFPQAIDIQDIVFSNLPSMDPDTATGEGRARLQTWDTAGSYTSYEWTGSGIAQAWDWAGIDNKWMTEGASDVAENVIIGVGGSFWLWLDPSYEGLSANISVTFTNPTH